MFIKLSPKTRRAFTMTEMMISMGLFGLIGVILMTLYMYSTTSFAALANYAQLDQINRTALDKLTRELRQAYQVVDVGSNSITLLTTNTSGIGAPYLSVTYSFNVAQKTLTRNASDGSSVVLLSNCSLIDFDVYQRNNVSNSFNQYPVATGNWSEYVKVVRLTWKASRQIPGRPDVSENIQTARVVIRKQH